MDNLPPLLEAFRCSRPFAFSLRKDPVEMLTYAVSVPPNFIGSLVLVIMNSTVNRSKLEKIVKKLTSIHKCLTLLRSGYSYQRDRKNVQLFMPMLVLAISKPFNANLGAL